MKFYRFLIAMIVILGIHPDSSGQRNYPPVIEGAKEITFKSIDDVNLNLWVFNPAMHQATDQTPAIVFFFGGGWNAGSPEQFVKHCEYLSARGMVAIVADYRVKTRHNVKAKTCVSDAKSAVRWIREHASELGVDPKRIAAGGGSAGGHLAAATATLPMFDESLENQSVSSKPNALVLFNPALILSPVDMEIEGQVKKLETMEERAGTKPVNISPYHHLTSDIPPTIIFHGIDDTTVPFKTAELFTIKMNKLGNSCKLVAYKGESHGFFNYGKNSNGAFISSVYEMDKFLVSLGYLAAPPETILIE